VEKRDHRHHVDLEMHPLNECVDAMALCALPFVVDGGGMVEGSTVDVPGSEAEAMTDYADVAVAEPLAATGYTTPWVVCQCEADNGWDESSS